jgi:hypothetical protein
MLRMWGDDVSSPLNVVHLGFGIGAVFANLLVKPFLGEDKNSYVLSDNSTIIIEKKVSNIQVPYSITAFICLLICVGHFIFLIHENRIERQSRKNDPINYSSVSTSIIKEKKVKYCEYSPQSCGNGYFNYGLLMSIIWIFYMFFLGGNDQTFGKFFFSFLKTP